MAKIDWLQRKCFNAESEYINKNYSFVLRSKSKFHWFVFCLATLIESVIKGKIKWKY